MVGLKCLKLMRKVLWFCGDFRLMKCVLVLLVCRLLVICCCCCMGNRILVFVLIVSVFFIWIFVSLVSMLLLVYLVRLNQFIEWFRYRQQFGLKKCMKCCVWFFRQFFIWNFRLNGLLLVWFEFSCMWLKWLFYFNVEWQVIMFSLCVMCMLDLGYLVLLQWLLFQCGLRWIVLCCSEWIVIENGNVCVLLEMLMWLCVMFGCSIRMVRVVMLFIELLIMQVSCLMFSVCMILIVV